jgi:hypothetical protein
MVTSANTSKRRSKAGRPSRKAVEQRIELARELSKSPTTTVTLRLPHRINEWLDAYVHGAWPERVRKQELVVEALMLLIARRGGPGEKVLDTDLLGEAD